MSMLSTLSIFLFLQAQTTVHRFEHLEQLEHLPLFVVFQSGPRKKTPSPSVSPNDRYQQTNQA